MAQAETIREFLVRLGFVTDEPALRKFSDGITKATKSVALLGATVTTVASTVFYGINRFAANLESLYFSAHRVGSTVTNLTAFQRAAQNFGATAEEAQSSIEGLAQTLATNPAYKGLLRGWGIDPNGDITKVMTQLGQVFRAQPLLVAKQWADQLGISYRLLLAIREVGFAPEVTRREQTLGPGLNQAAKDAHRFEEQIRDLWTTIEAFGARVFDVLENKLGLSLKDLNKWLGKNGRQLTDELAEGIRQLWDWINNKLIPTLKDWGQEYMNLDKRTGGWLTKILGLVVALRALGGTDILSAVASLGMAFVTLAASLGPISITIVAVSAAIVGLVKAVEWLNKTYPNNIFARMWGGYQDAQQRLAADQGQPQTASGFSRLWDVIRGRETFHQYLQEQQGLFAEGLAANIGGVPGQTVAATNTPGTIPWLWNKSGMADWFLGTGNYNSLAGNALAGTVAPNPAPNLSQQITININGAKSPEDTGRAVTSALQRYYSSIQRDAQPALE